MNAVGMVYMFVLWDDVFQVNITHNYFFTCRKICEVVGSLVSLRYTIIKQHDSIIYVLLRSLMRVVAMRLHLEVILFIKLYDPSDGSFFTSVSTYLKNNS